MRVRFTPIKHYDIITTENKLKHLANQLQIDCTIHRTPLKDRIDATLEGEQVDFLLRHMEKYSKFST